MRIGKRAVDGLLPRAEAFVAWDDELRGFGVRVQPSGVKSYCFKYRLGGGRAARQRWATIGRHGTLTPDQARSIARDLAFRVAQGGDPAGERLERRRAVTVAELLVEHQERWVGPRNKPRTAGQVAHVTARVIGPDLIARMKVGDIETRDVVAFRDRNAHRPTAANHGLAVLSKAFTNAEDWGHRPKGSNPCKGVARFPSRGRETFLTAAQYRRLGEVMSLAARGELTREVGGKTRAVYVSRAHLAAILLLLHTGARVSEVLGMRRAWVNLAAGRVNLPDSKSGKKPLMLSPAALDVMRGLGLPEDREGFVVRGGLAHLDPDVPVASLQDAWQKLRTAAGLEGVRLHDLRHSYASAMIEQRVPMPMVGALLGHRDVRTTARYVHLATDTLRAAADLGGAAIGGMLAPPPLAVPAESAEGVD